MSSRDNYVNPGPENQINGSRNYCLGSNGKYRLVNGSKVIKWNDYRAIRYNCQSNAIGLVPGFSIDSIMYRQYDTNWTSNDTLKAMERLVDKIRGHSFHLGKALGEGRQTVDLAVNTLNTMGRVALDLKRGRFGDALSHLVHGNPRVRGFEWQRPHRAPSTPQALASRFLEIKFGWEPLYNDVYESAKAFEALTKDARQWTAKGSAKSDLTVFSPGARIDFTLENRYKETYYAMLNERLSAPRSLGLLDPLGIAWELTPWSFLIDWFLPIGQYLDVLNILPFVDAEFWLTQTWRSRARDGKYNSWVLQNFDPAYPWASCYFKYDYLEIRRNPFSPINIPLPTFKPLDKALSPTHIAEAMALAFQRFR